MHDMTKSLNHYVILTKSSSELSNANSLLKKADQDIRESDGRNGNCEFRNADCGKQHRSASLRDNPPCSWRMSREAARLPTDHQIYFREEISHED